MKALIGLIGVLLIAFGGLMVSLSLGAFIRISSTIDFGNVIGNFTGFLLLGLGLWLIIQSGSGETRQSLPNQP